MSRDRGSRRPMQKDLLSSAFSQIKIKMSNLIKATKTSKTTMNAKRNSHHNSKATNTPALRFHHKSSFLLASFLLLVSLSAFFTTSADAIRLQVHKVDDKSTNAEEKRGAPSDIPSFYHRLYKHSLPLSDGSPRFLGPENQFDKKGDHSIYGNKGKQLL